MDKKNFERAVNSLPSLSSVVHRILSVINNPESSSSDIADVLKLDPVIAAKVLRLANSVYSGVPSRVSSLKNAVTFLGIKNISSLVLVYGLGVHADRSQMPFSLERFWRHSVFVAFVAEAIARYISKYESIDSNEVFSAALLHDIGKLVLGIVSPEIILSDHKTALAEKQPFYKVENESASHVNFGEKLADLWHFPSDLRAAIGCHHWIVPPSNYVKLVSIIHISDIMVHVIGYPVFENETVPSIEQDALREVHFPVETLRVIVDNALQNQKKIESLLETFS